MYLLAFLAKGEVQNLEKEVGIELPEPGSVDVSDLDNRGIDGWRGGEVTALDR
ncbi:MAG: hypothetical protein GVY28_12770, partial [Alphaproteobacteria bacterium]|nr:hypothetical protein [Alphaproteobacteria bacterium]